MRIAVVGSGISGLVCAWRLAQHHDVTVFEAGSHVGGHTHTHDVVAGGKSLAIDTGFIVFNRQTYPNFNRMLDELSVSSKPTTMSFSVSDPASGFEYASRLSGLFAQRRNLVRPAFYQMLAEKLRFDKLSKRLLEEGGSALKSLSLNEFLSHYGFSETFARWYILPMTAAVWSAPLDGIGDYPMHSLLCFLRNHGLLGVNEAPTWRVIEGGSREYVRALLKQLPNDVRLNCPVQSVKRGRRGVTIESARGKEKFDRVIFACHSDQALKLLADPTDAERSVLGAIPYQPNEAVLHTDTRMLPKAKAAWAAWNYVIPQQEAELSKAGATLTYNMNQLQGLESDQTWCVTLNQTDSIDPSKIVATMDYDHPVFNQASVAAQSRWHEISGHEQQTFYCGAYWFYGFHEDGVKSALRVVNAFPVATEKTVLRAA